MNFGGNNKGIIQVTDKGFDGCIRQISIDGTNIDFSDNVESIGVAYGCQVSRILSLMPTSLRPLILKTKSKILICFRAIANLMQASDVTVGFA